MCCISAPVDSMIGSSEVQCTILLLQQASTGWCVVAVEPKPEQGSGN